MYKYSIKDIEISSDKSDKADSDEENYVYNNNYFHNRRKQVNKTHFLSFTTCISVTRSKISKSPLPLPKTLSAQTCHFI